MGNTKPVKNVKQANGMGSIYKVQTAAGERWQASKTAGRDAKGKVIRITGTAKLRPDALARMQANYDRWLLSQNEVPSNQAHRDLVRFSETRRSDMASLPNPGGEVLD